ncbi:MAG: DUF2029 domain-containing protein [Candidatus Accumulibacter sp.]|jgi:Protein of unknown function (DUF2029).|uniref:glycosyltransferase 87 family protein n=1 Tax=Accumulibacter sp. TaxID=2053492 RepID=UPI001A647594|nr:glycosyltransferase 87 family protein [Accumulibacter sp.]MBL8368332.1 DUF2029 domain-containing protein [Accumulibacter sp.]MBN8514804.1 DUF2029 domain-containing protein [Accumulibacter sp.]MBO3701695.1 DUF2029 domain-containing protein [Accumulibacter sp.]HRI92561.1 glycosyltransferase 87 family protein [Accumulibacter sp.]
MKNEKHWRIAAWAIWLLPAALVVAIVVTAPLSRSVTEIYHGAVTHWWSLQPVYSGSVGFNYLPLFLPAFGLFAWLPLELGEILWRWAALAGLGVGLWRCTGPITTTSTGRYPLFVLVSLLSLPIGLSAIRNGQSSAQLAACLVLAAACLQQRRWSAATVWLCLALVCKPLAIPAIGLAVMAFPRLWWRALLGVLVVLLAPYLLAPSAYVHALYAAFATNLMDCFHPPDRTFADVNGVLMAFNVQLAGAPSLIVRVASGVAMALAIWFTARLAGDFRRVLLWLGFSTSYIMLFTPMNEANSYVMLAPALGLWAGWFLDRGETRMVHTFVLLSVSILLLADVIGLVLGKGVRNEFDKFWSPLMTFVFLAILVAQIRQMAAEAGQALRRSRALTAAPAIGTRPDQP